MDTQNKNWIVISLGGSLLVPDRVDGEYLKAFTDFIKIQISQGFSFAIITGGGRVCRDYNNALIQCGIADSETLDWMGISLTRSNATLLRFALRDHAEPEIFLDPRQVVLTGKPVLVGGGYKPGHSSDGSAVALAKTLGAKKLINLSNIDYVYTADPRIDLNAKPITETTWPLFRELLPTKWEPGLNAPFDPIAAGLAQEMGLEVAVMNGKNLANLGDYINGKEFVGTVIRG